uniref:Uncharacterized protein n=1 Tax=Gloeothece verrucosa (strain PCC 7822) TaxID=497965 RepID=E0UBN4_GLOV7|nr:hypothetical protein Cyan7822_1996 [Gloeothece verrucosa PCC 7822]
MKPVVYSFCYLIDKPVSIERCQGKIAHKSYAKRYIYCISILAPLFPKKCLRVLRLVEMSNSQQNFTKRKNFSRVMLCFNNFCSKFLLIVIVFTLSGAIKAEAITRYSRDFANFDRDDFPSIFLPQFRLSLLFSSIFKALLCYRLSVTITVRASLTLSPLYYIS